MPTTTDVDENDLSLFQQWVLFYFLSDKDASVDSETLADNMCLTAVVNFDIENIKPELDKLVNVGLIGENKTPNGLYYSSKLQGRIYVKQNILAPLIKIKSKDKIKGLAEYLRRNGQQEILVAELIGALEASDQNVFLDMVSKIALNKMGPFVDIMTKVKDFVNSDSSSNTHSYIRDVLDGMGSGTSGI